MSAAGQAAQALWRAGDRAGAIAQFRAAAAQCPGDPHCAARLGIALVRADLHAHGPGLAEGAALLAPVAAAAPQIVDARLWLGFAWLELRRTAAALALFDALLPLLPDAPDLHVARGHALLRLGRLEEGWAENAWRWRRRSLAQRAPAEPLTRPDPAAWAGRSVLLYAEQGHGDTIQCLRYVAPTQAAGARAVLEVQPALRRLAAAMPGVEVIAVGDPVPAHDFAVAMFDLPWAFGTIPAAPYLAADAAAVARWRARLAGLPGRRIGLAWAGDARADAPDRGMVDRRRSVPPARLAPLLALPGLSWVSLQKDAGQKDAGQKDTAWPDAALHDWTGELADFADTAALIAALDLVICVDTAVAHLAGALGRPVWLLNRWDADWRWGEAGADSAWYPTLRQFRQVAPGDWDGVVARIAAALVT